MPSRLAKKIIAVGRYGAKIAASCKAPLATVGSARPCFAAAARARPQIYSFERHRGSACFARVKFDRQSAARCDVGDKLLEPVIALFQHLVRAGESRMLNRTRPGMTLIPFGSTFNRPTVTTVLS